VAAIRKLEDAAILVEIPAADHQRMRPRLHLQQSRLGIRHAPRREVHLDRGKLQAEAPFDQRIDGAGLLADLVNHRRIFHRDMDDDEADRRRGQAHTANALHPQPGIALGRAGHLAGGHFARAQHGEAGFLRILQQPADAGQVLHDAATAFMRDDRGAATLPARDQPCLLHQAQRLADGVA